MKQKNPCTFCEARLSVMVADRPKYVCMLQPGDISEAQQTQHGDIAEAQQTQPGDIAEAQRTQPGDIAKAQQTCVKWHNYNLLLQAGG